MTIKIGPQELGRKREFENNGLKFTFEAHDPYGMISAYCSTHRKAIDGQFTGFREAEAAAIKYSNKVKETSK